MHVSSEWHLQAVDDGFAFRDELTPRAHVGIAAVYGMSLGGNSDFMEEFEQERVRSGGGSPWDFSPEDRSQAGASFAAADLDEDTFYVLNPLDVSRGSLPELDCYTQTPWQQQKVNCEAADAEPLLLFDKIVEATEEGSGHNAKFSEGFDSISMDITEERDDVAGLQSADSCTGFEANTFNDNLDVIMCSADGSTPSEACLSHELEEDHLLETEQSLPSHCSSVSGLTPFSSATSEMEIDEEDGETQMEEEEVASEENLLLIDATTWASVKFQYRLLHGDHSPLPEMCTNFYVDEANSIGSHGNQSIQGLESLHPVFIDWNFEKDCILERMLGKQTARTAPSPLHEELLRIVQNYQQFGKHGVQTARSFKRRITVVTNNYCVRHSRKVRYLPDFCKVALREWVQIDAHQRNPYPEKEEIRRLADELGLTPAQVEQWFENYRVRSWNPQQNGLRKGKFFRYPTERTAILREWILNHKDNPNPKGKELDGLMEKTAMTSAQVKQWCYNFRRRHKDEML